MSTESGLLEPAPRFWDLLAAEWIKLWSLRSIPWFVLLSALAAVGVNANAARAARAHWHSGPPPFTAHGALQEAFSRPAAAWVLLAMGAVGAIAILSEQTTGLLRTTFCAVPARREVMAAKVLVVTAVAAVFGVLTVAASVWCDAAILYGRYTGVPLTDAVALRITAASAVLAPLGALIGLGLGAVIRHSVATMVTLFLLAFILPVSITDRTHLSATLTHALPFNAWYRLTLPIAILHAPYPSTIPGAWLTFAAWAAAPALLVLLTVPRRDQ
ncbi:ABC transporter permease [Streptomyces sp. NPDC088197]|uniref:ABC transporter permease n=1 Tax=Streptomyces sp. NPDC088197 TaxID=3365840 RepID=UPI003812418A